MSSSQLPPRASLEYLKKLAKERLREMRREDPAARLSEAQLAVAREHGFPSWRALKAEVDRRSGSEREAFFAACDSGDAEALRELLDRDPSLAQARDGGGATCLHHAVRHPPALRLLLARGADPNAREDGDNALALHAAAGGGLVESARVLLDAGSDVQGSGDAHRLDTIGWATVFEDPRREVVDLLVERGARHHVFSAVALGDVGLLRRVVREDPAALSRRLSPTEQEQSALHYVVAPPDGLIGGTFRTGEHYRTLEALIELGADLEATDAKGRTPLAVAMLRGDERAMRLLHAAGARPPELPESPGPTLSPGVPEPTERPRPTAVDPTGRREAGLLTELAQSIGSITPMVAVPDIEATIAWYRAVGFELKGSHAGEPGIDWASVRLGAAEIMFVRAGDQRRERIRGLSLWMRSDRLDDLYAHLKRLQLARARTVLAGETPDQPELRFRADLYTAFYGQREFSIEDPNGLELWFFQPLEQPK